MGRVVVVGGGPIGLASAILLGREGHEVTLLEKDSQSAPATAMQAWGDWQRTGVAQFRQAHAMHARFRHLLDAEFPDVRDDILACGGRRMSLMSGLFKTMDDPSPLAGDEKFEVKATPMAKGPERDRLYAEHGKLMPGFLDYEKKTKRIIPVVVLERASSKA